MESWFAKGGRNCWFSPHFPFPSYLVNLNFSCVETANPVFSVPWPSKKEHAKANVFPSMTHPSQNTECPLLPPPWSVTWQDAKSSEPGSVTMAQGLWGRSQRCSTTRLLHNPPWLHGTDKILSVHAGSPYVVNPACYTNGSGSIKAFLHMRSVTIPTCAWVNITVVGFEGRFPLSNSFCLQTFDIYLVSWSLPCSWEMLNAF